MEGNIPRKKQNPHLFFERFRAAPRRVYTLVRVYKLTVRVRALEPFILQQDKEIIYFFVVWFQNQNIHTPITEKNLTQEPPRPPPPPTTTTTTTASLDFPSLQGTDDPSGTTRSVKVTFKLSRIETYRYWEQSYIVFFLVFTPFAVH